MTDDRHGWGPAIDEIERRKLLAAEMGGSARLVRQRERGRLNARERLFELFDIGTFTEIGALVGTAEDPVVPGDALVAGSGLIAGRPALAGAEDVTVLGGSIGAGGSSKRYRLCQLARQERVPLIMMLEGAGHRVTDSGGGALSPGDLMGMAELSGQVPMVCLVLGASAGHGALAAPLSDFSVMTESASIFAAGPPLVKSSIGEDVTKEVLGGPDVAVSLGGVVHNVVADDKTAIKLARDYLSFFPLNAWELPPATSGSSDTGPRRVDELLSIVPTDSRLPYDVRLVIDAIVDDGHSLEVQPDFGRSMVTALARIGGCSVGVVANNPAALAGSIDSRSADKAAHFLDVIGAFGLPCLFLTDNPGVLAGTRSEQAGILRHGARMFAMQHRLEVPKIHVTMRKAFGFGSTIMAMNPFDHQTMTLGFPSITLGVMPASSAAAAIDDPAERARIAAGQARGSINAGNRLSFDDVIDPRELRNAVLAGLALAGGRRTSPRQPRGIGILP